ncbi:MAG: sialate O-acetylesterase [Roseivirga sp.]|nr:sialate O-acetylesterase [Roseivirga sp.]
MFSHKFRPLVVLIILAVLVSCDSKSVDSLALSPLFSDHMVLQQKESVAIWGESGANQTVTISGSWGSEVEGEADENGHWQLIIPTPAAGGPFEVQVSTRDSTIKIADVMIGEIWLASGQSNMEMPLKGWPPNDIIQNSAEEISNAAYPDIRMLTVQRNLTANPINSITGSWEVTSPQTAGDFSATAYFFARKLHQQLNIPIGIIHSSWGGTPAEAWASKSKLTSLRDFDKALESLGNSASQQATNDWFAKWETVSIPNTEDDWNNISFADEQASQADFDDSKWSEAELPGRFDELGSGEIDGAIWLRKKFTITNLDTEYTLDIGAIDDMDATYVNGQKIGGLGGPGYYNVKREYTVPTSILKEGENVIAIRAIDTGGPGAVNGPITLSSGSGEKIDLNGTWKSRPVAEIYQGKFYSYTLDENGFEARPDIRKLSSGTPSVLFNAMINPLLPYTIKGAIWYQGESNVGRATQYERLFSAMIEDWRERWNNDFPFYFVQIAPFRYHTGPIENDQSQKLRDAQRKTLSTINTGMVVTMDIGNYTNIHPANKQDVGARLAGLALANDYGKDLIASGPLYRSHRVDGNKIIVEFDHVGSGLDIVKGRLSGFEIAGENKDFISVKAFVVDNTVEVYHPSIQKPMYVRYAWKDRGIPTLFNKEGLPASSFSTEK